MVKALETFGGAPVIIARFTTSIGFEFHHSPAHHHHPPNHQYLGYIQLEIWATAIGIGLNITPILVQPMID